MSLVKSNGLQVGQSVTATNNFTMYQPASPDGTVRWGVGNSGSATDIMTLNSSGNVGVGTSSPGAKLDVAGGVTRIQSGGTGGLFGNDNASYTLLAASATANAAGIYLNGQARSGFASFIQYAGAQHVWLNETVGVERMRIDSSGNVGIGTSSPENFSGYKTIQAQGTTTSSGGIFQSTTSDSGVKARFYTDGTGGNINVATNHPFLLFTNNAERMRIDSSGNVGIGTSSPNPQSGVFTPYFTVKGASYDGVMQVLGSRGDAANTGVGQFNFLQDGNTTYKTIAQVTAETEGTTANNRGGRLMFFTKADGATSTTERMRIDSSGNLLVGTTSAAGSEKLSVTSTVNNAIARFHNDATSGSVNGLYVRYRNLTPNNTASQFLYCDDFTALRAEIRSNGGLVNYQANNGNLSDRREKTDFAPAKDYLDVICNIPVQTFKYIDQTDEDLTLGVVAQDVQTVAPELVSESNWGTEENPKMRLSIYQTDLQYALMKCIQEQQAIIESLTKRIETLEGA